MLYKSLLIGIIIIQMTACALLNGQAVNNQNMNQSTAKAETKTDIEALAKTINLPVRPQEAKWQSKTMGTNATPSVPGPSDYVLTAVLKYSDSDVQELIKKLNAVPTDKKLANAEVEEWFPEEVKKAAKTVEGKEKIEGANYAPDAFLRSPYSNGKVLRVGETNYFIVKVFTS